MIKPVACVVVALMAFDLPAREPCDAASVGLTDASTEAERLFFTGTCHFRNGEHEKSVDLWTRLIERDETDARVRELQADALSNLGYMLFFGNGVATDRRRAVENWQRAVTIGHTEAHYHLCHAHADRAQPTFDAAVARPHCETARRIYARIESPTASDRTILAQVDRYLGGLDE